VAAQELQGLEEGTTEVMSRRAFPARQAVAAPTWRSATAGKQRLVKLGRRSWLICRGKVVQFHRDVCGIVRR